MIIDLSAIISNVITGIFNTATKHVVRIVKDYAISTGVMIALIVIKALVMANALMNVMKGM